MSAVSEPEPVELADDAGSADPHGSPSHGGLKFRPDIEGLRAVAVLMVVLSHLAVPGFGAGFVGVDVFFVISGFLITSLLAKEYSDRREESGRGRISIAGFYKRRALRILPAAMTVIAAVLVASKAMLNELAYVKVQADALWATLFATNIELIRSSADYFQAGFAKSPLQNYWSLAVEEQFYLVWPLCFAIVAALVTRRGRDGDWRKAVRAAVIAIALGSFAWSVVAASSDPAAGYFSTLTRAWQLGLGAFIALTPSIARRMTGGAARACGLAGLVLLGLALALCDEGSGYPGAIALLPTVGAGLLLSSGLSGDRSNIAGRMLSLRGPRAIGRISYSLYLWHWPLIVLAGMEWGESAETPQARALLFVLSIAVATASYLIIERPFVAIGRVGFRKSLGDGASRVPKLLTLIAVPAFAVAVIGSGARPLPDSNRGIPNAGAEVPKAKWISELRQAAGQTTITKSEEKVAKALVERHLVSSDGEEEGQSRLKSSRGGKKCVSLATITSYQQAVHCSSYGKGLARVSWPSSVKPKAALIGNSFAGQWVYELARILPRDVILFPLTVTSCKPWVLDDSGQVDSHGYSCDEHRDLVFNSIRRSKPGLAIVSYQRVMNLDRQLEATTALVRKLRKEVPNVLFIGPAPVLLPFDRCLNKERRAASCNRLLGWKENRSDQLFARAVRAGGGTYISTQRLLCTRAVCPAFIDGRPTRFDGIHATRWAARGVGMFLADAIERAVARPGSRTPSRKR